MPGQDNHGVEEQCRKVSCKAAHGMLACSSANPCNIEEQVCNTRLQGQGALQGLLPFGLISNPLKTNLLTLMLPSVVCRASSRHEADH